MSESNAAPDRVSIPTCIGCGAMSRPGTCDTGCAEHKLLLIRASALDALTDTETRILQNTTALAMPAEQLLDRRGEAREWPGAFASVQEHARTALRHAPEDPATADEIDTIAEPAVTWWCDRCGGIDAPQPCLGICVWRAIDWAHQSSYQDTRERILAERQNEQRLRALLRRLACTTPHHGQHERSWRAFAAQAAEALDRPTKHESHGVER
jgi:hypothetical protein